MLATPLATVARDVAHGTDLATIAGLVAEHDVGRRRRRPAPDPGRARGPGRRGGAGVRRRRSPGALAVPVELADERLTTVVATRQMRESGRKGRRQRAVVDQVAAVAILQGWLDARREPL